MTTTEKKLVGVLEIQVWSDEDPDGDTTAVITSKFLDARGRWKSTAEFLPGDEEVYAGVCKAAIFWTLRARHMSGETSPQSGGDSTEH